MKAGRGSPARSVGTPDARRIPGGPSSPDEAVSVLRAEGLEPTTWGNGPGAAYGWHRHGAPKVLCCVRGSIVFRTRAGELALGTGDRLELAEGVAHAATVGPDGVECVEAYRSSRTDTRR